MTDARAALSAAIDSVLAAPWPKPQPYVISPRTAEIIRTRLGLPDGSPITLEQYAQVMADLLRESQ